MSRRPWRARRSAAERQEAERAGRETEQALVDALQDSDTPAELLHDELDAPASADDIRPGGRRPAHRRIVGAVTLAALALLVARRRR